MSKLWAGAALGLVLATPAAAGQWSAPDATLTFTAPDDWAVTRAPAQDFTYVVARGGAGECHFLAKPRPTTADATPYDIRAVGKEPLAPAVWSTMPQALPRLFADAQFVSSTIDDETYWPIQFGRYEGPSRIVHAAVQFRPGMEYWAFCFAPTLAQDDPTTFDSVLRSVAGATDAQLHASIDEYEARRERDRRRHVEALQDETRLRNSLTNTLRTPPPPPPTGSGPSR